MPAVTAHDLHPLEGEALATYEYLMSLYLENMRKTDARDTRTLTCSPPYVYTINLVSPDHISFFADRLRWQCNYEGFVVPFICLLYPKPYPGGDAWVWSTNLVYGDYSTNLVDGNYLRTSVNKHSRWVSAYCGFYNMGAHTNNRMIQETIKHTPEGVPSLISTVESATWSRITALTHFEPIYVNQRTELSVVDIVARETRAAEYAIYSV